MNKKLNIMVVGAGAMGAGIAQVFAANGHKTILVSRSTQSIEKGARAIAFNSAALVEEGIYSAKEMANISELLSYDVLASLEKASAGIDMVIESIYESVDDKRDIFAKLDKYCSESCIFCSNTSGLNIFDIADISHPERLIVTHWFNPPYVMKLVEIVAGPQTSQKTIDEVRELYIQIGKEPAFIKQYIPGFIINRLATALMREACYMVTQGWTTPEDIDSAIKAINGVRYPFEGPMGLYDVVGWDLVQAGAMHTHKSLCNSTEGGNSLAAELIAKGHLGLKSGKGAFDYTGVDPAEFMKKRSSNILRMIKNIKELEK